MTMSDTRRVGNTGIVLLGKGLNRREHIGVSLVLAKSADDNLSGIVSKI